MKHIRSVPVLYISLTALISIMLLPAGAPASGTYVYRVTDEWGYNDSEFWPTAVATDSSGNIYVANADGDCILKYDSDGAFLTAWGTSLLDEPMGIAVDNSMGYVYVADTGNDRIQVFTTGGTYVKQIGGPGDDPLEFDQPHGLSVHGGVLYVADRFNDRIQLIITATDSFDSIIAIDQPVDITHSSSGNTYVASAGEETVFVYDNNTQIGQFGSWGLCDGQFIYPLSLAAGVFGNDIYVLDSELSEVQKFTSSGTFVDSWGAPGTGTGRLSRPRGIACGTFTGGEAVIVADSDNCRIQRVSTDGDYLDQWRADGIGPYNLDRPRGVAFDAAGNVYVADSSHCRIMKYDSSGTYLLQWGRCSDGNEQLSWPIGLAVGASGHVYVADSDNCRIKKFTDNGTFISMWGTEGNGPGQFDEPQGVAVDGSGYVYVADTGNHRIQKFLDNGTAVTHIASWGKVDPVNGYPVPGNGDGEFEYPHDVAVDGSGYVYVADSGNCRIQQLTTGGTFQQWWGRNSFGSPDCGSGPGEFDWPVSVAVDSGYIYVADTGNDRIQMIDPDDNGTSLLILGDNGTGFGNGEFLEPRGVAVRGDLICAADTGNSRIQMFDNSTFQTAWGDKIMPDGQLSGAEGIAAGPDGTVYVLDTQNHRVQTFNSDGVFLDQWGSLGSDPGQFFLPGGIAVVEAVTRTLLYVADTGNSRVQKFDTDGTYLTSWSSWSADNATDALSGPRGIAADFDNGTVTVYVADTHNDRLVVFNENGDRIDVYGSSGEGSGQFDWPCDIALYRDSGLTIYVADGGNDRIQIFNTAEGISYQGQWGSTGCDNGSFEEPRHVAADDNGSIYVTDECTGRVQKFTSAGSFMGSWGSDYGEDCEFGDAAALAADGSDILLASWDQVLRFAQDAAPGCSLPLNETSRLIPNSSLCFSVSSWNRGNVLVNVILALFSWSSPLLSLEIIS